uniref:Uncharacterized protein n=1 Tax=Rhizophora mucronata TaxID=61149 RepID=A0A2P2ISG4_RHIMU
MFHFFMIYFVIITELLTRAMWFPLSSKYRWDYISSEL